MKSRTRKKHKNLKWYTFISKGDTLKRKENTLKRSEMLCTQKFL